MHKRSRVRNYFILIDVLPRIVHQRHWALTEAAWADQLGGKLASTLVGDKRAEIMQRYSHLFVECNDNEVQHLYWLLSLFFAKCDGLLSPAEVRRLEDDPSGTVIHSVFSPYLTDIGRRESIIAGLKFLKQYNVNKPKEIIATLTQRIFRPEKLNASDRKYLIEFTENPDRPLKWFAGRLGVSISSVTRAHQRLRKAIEFRFFCSLNFPSFRLKHFVLYFKPNESFRRPMLSAREITRTLNCDTFGEWMWASFLVPDQDRILKEFKGSIARFAGKVLREHRLYEVKSYARHSNLTMFDGEKWFFSEESLGIGAFKHAEANREILPRLKEFQYGDEPIRFDQVDFLLSLLMSSDALAKNSELRKILKEDNYGSLSQVVVSKRLAALKRSGALFPYYGFTGLSLDTAIAFAIECDDGVCDTFYHMFPLFPDCWAYRTDKGILGMVRTPSEMSSRISYLMQSLKDEVRDLIITSRFESLGARTWRHLVKYWNDEKQYWDFERGFFDLCRGIDSAH